MLSKIGHQVYSDDTVQSGREFLGFQYINILPTIIFRGHQIVSPSSSSWLSYVVGKFTGWNFVKSHEVYFRLPTTVQLKNSTQSAKLYLFKTWAALQLVVVAKDVALRSCLQKQDNLVQSYAHCSKGVGRSPGVERPCSGREYFSARSAKNFLTCLFFTYEETAAGCCSALPGHRGTQVRFNATKGTERSLVD